MNIFVQSFLNSATTGTFTITTTTSVLQLKQAVYAWEGVTTTIMQLHYNDIEMVNTATVVSYGVTTGTLVYSSNNISDPTLYTKEQRQIHKLNLAQLRRQAGGNTTTNYYRVYNVYDRDLLADKYVGNTATGVANTLTIHRPWI